MSLLRSKKRGSFNDVNLYERLSEWAPAGMPTSEEFKAFRRDYQRFRSGRSRGAKGEAAAIDLGAEVGQESTGSWESILGVDGLACKDPEDFREQGYLEVRRFRLAYRRHRMGAARGAKGEVMDLGHALSDADVRLLPVSQLAHFKKQLSSWNEAARSNDFKDLSGLHLHFGAGKIGLGLVLPALVEGARPFAILQRPSAVWADALRRSVCAIRINGDSVVELQVATSLRDFDHALASKKRALLVLSDDPAVICAVVSRSVSLSCAVGGKDLSTPLAPLIQAVHAVHKQAAKEGADEATAHAKAPVVPLYACENDHDAVEKLAEALEGKVDVVPVLVDRVCTTRDMRGDGSVDVGTEDYLGDLVFPPPAIDETTTTGGAKTNGAARPPARPPLPFGGETVRLPQTEEGASFLHRKKILTVNGTHTTIAFLTLIAGEKADHVGPPAGSHELLAFDLKAGRDDAIGRTVWVWAVARQVMLVNEFDRSVMSHTLLGKEDADDTAIAAALVAGARAAVGRLAGGGDQTSRVLGGGVETRWRGRLANVLDFLQQSRGLERLARAVLRAADVSETELNETVEKLVQDSRRFVMEPPQAMKGGSA